MKRSTINSIINADLSNSTKTQMLLPAIIDELQSAKISYTIDFLESEGIRIYVKHYDVKKITMSGIRIYFHYWDSSMQTELLITYPKWKQTFKKFMLNEY